jgi:predicted RNA binding protein YcfA (HicA-like mRNA interferase family)
MPKLPSITANEIIKLLLKIGFEKVRQKDSHIRLKHSDNRIVTIPVHSGKILGKGLLKKILRDSELTVEELLELL